MSSDFTIIRGGRVLDAAAHRADPADVLVDGNRIAEVWPPGARAPEGAQLLDATDRLLAPGLINAHTHGHGGLGKGLGDRWTLELLLNAGPWISGNRSLEHKYLAALLGAIEMIKKGCTSVYDLYVELPMPTVDGMQAVGKAYQDAGMRAVVTPLIADRSFFEAIPGLIDALPAELKAQAEAIKLTPGEATVDACRTLLQNWPFDRERIRLALGPTIPLHCSDDFIIANRDLAREFGVGLHMHLAESKVQAVSGLELYGKTLTAHLDELGFLSSEFTAAHAIWLDADDIKRLADNGCSVAHNPGSNMRLGSGHAAVREMLDAGLNVGIGTDAAHCADNQNMFEAMRFASFVSRVRSHDYEQWLRTEEVFDMATVGSARALGFGDDIGRIEPGCKADIVFFDLDHINFVPLNDPTNQVVHSEDGGGVESVMVDGRLVLEHGRFTRLDTERLRSDAQNAVAELAGLNRESRALAEQLEAHVGRFCIGLARKPYHVHAMAEPHP